jgi:predicted aspartyl protease
MKKATLARLAIRATLFYFMLGGICQSIQAQSEIRFRLVRDTLVVVSLTANDQGPFDFVLDTGADTTIVDPSLANTLSLVSAGSLQQTTLAGIQTLTRSSIRSMAIGGGRVENVPVLVEDLGGLRNMDGRIEGIAGQNFLAHFNYLLDYRKNSVRIEQADEIQQALDGDRVPMDRSDNRMIVALEAQSVGRAKLRLLLDSGANTVVLLPAASHALNLSAQEGGVETTSSGKVGLHICRILALTVGSQQLHEIAVALASTAPAEQIGDGLLPTALFRSLYVNNREGFVVLNPRAKKN